MILHGIRVRDWGPFREEAGLEDLSPGLNVLAGPNGSGKSTLAQAIAHALFDRHGSNTDRIRRLRPWDTELGPRVVVDLTCHGRRWRVEKTYLASPRAVLLERDGDAWLRRAEGREAEEKLDDVLGLRRGRGALRPEDRGPTEALWVAQGRTTVPPAPNPITRERLRAVVDEALDAGCAGRLSRRVAGEWEKHFTPTGRPAKGSERLRLEAELARAREARIEAESRLAGLSRAEEELARWTSAGSSLKGELEEAGARLEDARRRAEMVRTVRDARAAWESANEVLREITALREAIREHREGAERARAEVEALAVELERVHRREAAGRLREIEGELGRVDEAERLLEEARADERRVAEIGALPADDLREVERIESELAGLRNEAAESATRVRLSPTGDLTGTAGDESLELCAGETRDWTAADALRIEIDGVGAIEVVPAGTEERAARISGLRERRRALASEPVDELRRRVEEARACAKRADRAQALAEGILDDRDAAVRRDELSTRRDALLAEHPDLVAIADEEVADGEDVRGRLDDGRERQFRHEERLRKAEERLTELGADGRENAAREAERRRLLTELDLAEQRLEALGEDDVGATDLEREVERLRRDLREAEVEGARARERLESGRRDALVARLRRLREEETELETRHRAAAARAEATGLLRDVLERHRRTSLERVMTPVLERVREDLPRVIDARYASLEVNEGTQAAEAVRLERDGRAVELGDLSYGTREQVLLLARLALGEVLARGERELVVLDDALVNTDADRRARLLDRLAEAAERLQILVLTCHPEHYEPLEAKHHHLLTAGTFS